MKRFTFLFSVLGILVFWAIVQSVSESRVEAKAASSAPIVYDATGAMLEAVGASEAKASAPLVYDARGAMLEAIEPKEAVAPLVYDATGAMLEAINP